MEGVQKKGIGNIFFTGCDLTVKEGLRDVAYLQINKLKIHSMGTFEKGYLGRLMENRKMRLSIIIFILVFPNGILAQIKDSKSKKYRVDETVIKGIKKIALCKCIQNGYYSDSALQNDPSSFIISDVEIDNFGPVSFIDSITKVYIANLPKYKPGRQSESLEKSPILLHCIEFYESRRLDSLVRNWVRNSY